MAERGKTQRKAKNPASGTADATPEAEAKLEAAAKREAESKSGGKGRGGSKQAKKVEEKGASQAGKKTTAKSKPSAKGTSTKAKGSDTKAKTADTKTAQKSKAKRPAASKAKATEKEAPQRPVVNARARYVRIAPRKARLIADQVRGLPLEDAQTLLRFSPRGAARDISKLIDSAVANAEQNHDLVADDLLVKEVTVDEGPTLRRYRPRALGRATRINKRTSHIHVALTPEE
jgi:ribosomal protein L22